MKVKDIIQTDKFNEFLGYEIEAYNNRPALEEGKVYRRAPYDSLKEAGSFTVEGVRDEFTRVANYESRLPKVQRDAITGLVFRVAQTVVNYFAQEEAKKKAQEEPELNPYMKYFASCSFGKDSVATVLLAIENNEPLDGILFSEIVFDHKRSISGEIPEHIEWVYNTAIPTFERMGVPTKVIKSEKDYMYFFTNTVGGGKYKGKIYGFPIGGRCVINRDCKVGAIKKYLRTIGEEYTQYIGIAIDEPKRLARLKDNQISLLAKYGYTEQMAMELCRKYNLLSPIYETGTRGGCWFCPNAKISALANFRNKHPELWQELEILSHTENLCTTGFKWGLTLQEVNEKIDKFNKKQIQNVTARNYGKIRI